MGEVPSGRIEWPSLRVAEIIETLPSGPWLLSNKACFHGRLESAALPLGHADVCSQPGLWEMRALSHILKPSPTFLEKPDGAWPVAGTSWGWFPESWGWPGGEEVRAEGSLPDQGNPSPGSVQYNPLFAEIRGAG